MSSGPSSLLNDNPHNGGFGLLWAYLWHVKYRGAGFYWLLFQFRRDFLGWAGTSEDCLQANRNVLPSGRSRQTEQTADANKAGAFERGVWTDNDGVHGSSLLSAWPITPASLVPFKFIHAATTLK